MKLNNAAIWISIIAIIGFQIYQYQNVQTNNRILERAIKENMETTPSYITGIRKDISILQESTFDYHIIKGQVILSHKLNVPVEKIYFDRFIYSFAGDNIKAVEYLIGGPCDSGYGCDTFTVDVDTGVISKF